MKPETKVDPNAPPMATEMAQPAGGPPVANAQPAAPPMAMAQPAPTVVMVQPQPGQMAVAQPGMAVAQPGVVQVVQVANDPNAPPPGAPGGGNYVTQTYIGMITLIVVAVLVLLFWPACCAPLCCPCDQRRVYQVNGVNYHPDGRQVSTQECCGKPCGN